LSTYSNVADRIDLKFLKTKTFGSGAASLFYQPKRMSAWLSDGLKLGEVEVKNISWIFEAGEK